MNNVTIIGAGQAGSQAAQALRKKGFDGEITLIGNEGYLPYQRPPLSKAFLKDQIEQERLYFKPEAKYQDLNIRVLPDAEASSVDTGKRVVTCSDGQLVNYDRLIFATGSSPIALPCPGGQLEGVFTLRGIDDAKAIRDSLKNSKSLAVIGGGYIGLEVASAARQLDIEVTVIERMPRLLSRVTSPPVSEFYLGLHRGNGVDVRLECAVASIAGESRVAAVQLESGEEIQTDTVLVGIGARPNQALAEAAGIRCDGGILVDEHCRTSDPAVYAAGDCSRQMLGSGATLRLESVHNARHQADHVAAAILGESAPVFQAPWFWSDQYEAKLQTVGLFNDHTDIVIHGDASDGKMAVLYFLQDRLIALDAINDPVSFMAGKKILGKGLEVTRNEAMQPGVDLKALCAKA